MTILSLEFSTHVRSVAVWLEGTPSDEQIMVTAEDTGRHRIHPLTLIQQALERANINPKDIGLIAAGRGPGSYTGIRSAIAVAQGWSLGHAIEVAGISTVACLAEQALRLGITGKFHVVIDAQRDEFYVADYESDQVTVRLEKELRILSRTETLGLAHHLIGPELIACGLTGTETIPRASIIGLLAKREDGTINPSKLVPIYLRETAFVKAPPLRILPVI